MKASDECVRLIQHFESCSLTSYPDPASELAKACIAKKIGIMAYKSLKNWQQYKGHPWTIGWGHTGKDVKPDMQITHRKADELLLEDMRSFVEDVNGLVKVTVTQRQFDALVSFAFNVGSDIDADTIAEGLGDSTLLKYVNASKFDLAADEFLKWNKAGGQVLRGLTRRRAAERALFKGSMVEGAIRIGEAAV